MSAGRIFLVIVALLISTVRLSAHTSEKPIGILLAVGDIAICLAYKHGSPQNFRCFDAAWGEFKDKILPVPGNHDYETNNGAAYFRYFEAVLRNLKAAK